MLIDKIKFFLFFLVVVETFSLPTDAEEVNGDETENSSQDGEEMVKHILKGTEAYSGQKPYQVLIKSNGQFICSGSLISEQYVLTAASCLSYWNRWKLTVTLGAVSLKEITDVVTMRIRSEDIFIHPKYDSYLERHNIALIKLPRKLKQFSERVYRIFPVIIASNGMEPFWDQGVEAFISGWGYSSSSSDELSRQLMVRNITIMSRDDCDNQFLERTYNQMDRFKMCSMDTKGAVCYGDTGGPVTALCPRQNDTGLEIQIGIITTEEKGRCLPGKLVTYTLVSPYSDWIWSLITIQDHLDSLEDPFFPNSA